MDVAPPIPRTTVQKAEQAMPAPSRPNQSTVPESVFQRRTVVSSDPDRASDPSGDKATLVTR